MTRRFFWGVEGIQKGALRRSVTETFDLAKVLERNTYENTDYFDLQFDACALQHQCARASSDQGKEKSCYY
jgi:hypothetical protein